MSASDRAANVRMTLDVMRLIASSTGRLQIQLIDPVEKTAPPDAVSK